jgi:acyl carrier protein
VGPDDAFLNVGGDSITATLLVIRVEQEFSLELPLMIFFEATTIRKQSTLIDRLLADLPNETATAP